MTATPAFLACVALRSSQRSDAELNGTFADSRQVGSLSANSLTLSGLFL